MNWKKSLNARFKAIDKQELIPIAGVTLAIPIFTLVGIFLVNASNDSIRIGTDSYVAFEQMENLQQLTIGPNNASVGVEVADTPEARSVGLMFRTELPAEQGMLFIFPESQVLTFWMKNTFVPLDIIFFDENKTIVAIHENTITNNDQLQYSSNLPSKYALEVNAGFARAHGLQVGDSITSSYP
jgi:uncharacterized membrane protein (UPF0127 family)